MLALLRDHDFEVVRANHQGLVARAVEADQCLIQFSKKTGSAILVQRFQHPDDGAEPGTENVDPVLAVAKPE